MLPKFGLMFKPTEDIQVFADATMSRDVPDYIDLTQSLFPPSPAVDAESEWDLWLSVESP